MEKNSEETLCSRGGNVHSSTFCAFLVFPSSLALTHSDLYDSKTQFRQYFLTSVLPGLHPSFFFVTLVALVCQTLLFRRTTAECC